MSDRFKFRAWHKPTKRLFNVYGFNENFVFEDTFDGAYTSEINPAKTDDCILEQCTGLKDKNVNLIYKGDIVKQSLLIDMESYSGGEYTYIDMDIIGVVSITMSRGARINRPRIFITKDPYKDKQEERPSTSRHLVASRCEVIGNIHENRELLR